MKQEFSLRDKMAMLTLIEVKFPINLSRVLTDVAMKITETIGNKNELAKIYIELAFTALQTWDATIVSM